MLLAFFLGCVLGAVGGTIHRLATGDAYVFFGPFLPAGGLIVLFAGEPILDFLFVTWPQWQQETAGSHWILATTAIVCLVSLVVLVRRGRH